MNCRRFQHRMVELLDLNPDEPIDPDLRAHIDECPECRQELANARELLGDLRLSRPIHSSPSFKERVMRKAAQFTTLEHLERPTARPTWRAFSPLRLAVAAALLIAAAGAYNWFAGRSGNHQISAFSILAQAAEALNRAATYHIRCNMRGASEQDNFDTLDLNHDMIPIDVWVDSGTPARWRVDKGGRVVTCDGKSVLMLAYPDNDRSSPPLVFTGPVQAGFAGALSPLLDVEKLLNWQIEKAKQEGSTLLLTNEKASDGRQKAVLTIEAKAQGDFSQSDYSRNSSILESDNTRAYQFDAQTGRLEQMQVFVKKDGKDIPVLEVASIEYDVPVQDQLFSTQVPEGAVQKDAMDKTAGIAAASPREIAERFFQAMSQGDWTALDKIYPGAGTMIAQRPELAESLKGIQVIQLGEPFKSGAYPGWFVPYEIRDKAGETKKLNLSVIKDAASGLWHVDGGF